MQTILPNGNAIKEKLRHHTVLDCVLHFPTQTMYVLDVLKWKGYDYFHCTAEFRHEWKESLIDDLRIDYENMKKSNTCSETTKKAISRFWKVKCLKAFNCNELENSEPIKKSNSILGATSITDSAATSVTSAFTDEIEDRLNANNEILKAAAEGPLSSGGLQLGNYQDPAELMDVNFSGPGDAIDLGCRYETEGGKYYYKNEWKLDGILGCAQNYVIFLRVSITACGNF